MQLDRTAPKVAENFQPGKDVDLMALYVAQRRAVALTRILSTHHATCGPCQRGGRVVAGRAGMRRERCEVERRLLAELGAAQDEGWPV